MSGLRSMRREGGRRRRDAAIAARKSAIANNAAMRAAAQRTLAALPPGWVSIELPGREQPIPYAPTKRRMGGKGK